MGSSWKTFVTMIAVTVAVNMALLLVAQRGVSAEPHVVVVHAPAPAPPQPSVAPTYDEGMWEPEPSEGETPPPRPVEQVRRDLQSFHVARNPSPSSVPAPSTSARKPFYLVASPESNGNRFMVKLLTSAGCFGQSGHEQPFDEPSGRGATRAQWPNRLRDKRLWPRGHEKAPCAVMHRSIPHAGVWPDIPGLVQQIDAAGYEPRILVSWRPEDIARASQVSQKHVRTQEDAERNILRAQRHIVHALSQLPTTWFRFVLYEQLGHTHYLDWLFREQMALTLPDGHPKFEDRDSKHFH